MKRYVLSLLALALVAVTAGAEPVWCVVADGQTRVAMSNVAFMLAADDADKFSIVCQDGTVVGGVSKVTFERAEPTAVAPVRGTAVGDTPWLDGTVGGKLRLMGCAEGTSIGVYDLAGAKVAEASLGADGLVDIGALRAGVYLLKVGKAAIKFTKR